MWQGAASCVERVFDRVVQQIRDFGRVDVGETEETPREVRWIVVRSEEASELAVEHVLHVLTQLISFANPLADDFLARWILHVLILFDQLLQHL